MFTSNLRVREFIECVCVCVRRDDDIVDDGRTIGDDDDDRNGQPKWSARVRSANETQRQYCRKATRPESILDPGRIRTHTLTHIRTLDEMLVCVCVCGSVCTASAEYSGNESPRWWRAC